MKTRHRLSIPISKLAAVVSVLLAVAACTTVATKPTAEPEATQDETSAAAADGERVGPQAPAADDASQSVANEDKVPADATASRSAATPADEGTASSETTTGTGAEVEPRYLLVRIERMLPSGVIDSVREIARDPSTGRVVTETFGVPDARARKRSEYRYPEAGVVHITRFADDGTVESSTERSYEGGVLVREVQLDARGNVSLESTYRYEGGRIATWSLANSEGETMSTSQYHYEGSRLTRIENLDDDGVLQDYVVTEYDGEGRRVSEKLVDAESGRTLSVTLYEHDGLGRTSAVQETGLGINREIRYEYDSRDNVASEAIYGPRNQMLYVNRYTYERFRPKEASKP